MDPDACLLLIHERLRALRGGDEDARTEAVEALRSLTAWLEKGGFPPRVVFVPAE